MTGPLIAYNMTDDSAASMMVTVTVTRQLTADGMTTKKQNVWWLLLMRLCNELQTTQPKIMQSARWIP